ncbi:MAG: TonB-dependent receptor domain-containing protein [bacterium]
MFRKILFHTTLGWLLAASVFAQTKGTIQGRITDGDTGEGLPGVNVLVLGTYHGAATDLQGYYEITNMSPGVYNLKISFIGYTIVQKTGVKVNASEVTTVDIALQPTILAFGQEVTVIGEKPLLDVEDTASRKRITSEDIGFAVVKDVKDIVSNQSGVVEMDDEIHIRGGRANENAYLLDGLSVQDPLSGTGFGLRLSANAIEEVEVITGGFDAEYGQAMSGVVQVKTKEGSSKYHGSLSYKLDHFGPDWQANFHTDAVDFSLSGPELISHLLLKPLGIKIPGELDFFASGSFYISDSYLNKATELKPTIVSDVFAPRQNNEWSGLANFIWKITPQHRLKFSFNRSVTTSQNTRALQTTLEFERAGPGYPFRFQKILDNFNTFAHDINQQSLTWTQTLGSKSFYQLRFSRFFTNLRSQVGNLHWTQYVRAEDIVTVPPGGIPDDQYFRDPRGDFVTIKPDGFFDVGNGDTWHDHYVEEFTLRGDISIIPNQIHQIKAGFETGFQEMQMVEIIKPWFGGLGLNNDIYRVNPRVGAVYLQDRITRQGLIINIGLRYDYWVPGQFVVDALDRFSKDPTLSEDDRQIWQRRRDLYFDDTFGFLGQRVKGRLMPRLGISHPISDHQVFFFSYGHFSKRPKPQFVYTQLGASSARSTFQVKGNPNLNPETTVSYELGLKHQFTANDVLTVTLYNRDIFDYVTTKNVRGRGRQSDFLTYINLDFARVRGIEIEYKKRSGGFISGSISGNFSVATGKNSSPQDNLLVFAGELQEEPIKENFLRWDRPIQLNAIVNFFLKKGEGPRFLGVKIPDNWNLNMHWFLESGRRYTPFILSPSGNFVLDNQDPFSKVSRFWSVVDLNFEKYFDIFGVNMTFFTEVTNLFNRNNDTIINSLTGRAYRTGDFIIIDGVPTDPITFNDTEPGRPIIDPFNPARFRAPRQVLIGASVDW